MLWKSSMESNIENTRIKQLDGLRGLAAIMVLALHFPVENSLLTNNFIVRQSWLFVDFFFVLSGFIISTNYYNKLYSFETLKEYIKKRFLRLYPLLFFTVVFFFMYTLIGLSLGLKADAFPISFYIRETFDSLLFLNSTKILGETQGMNPPSWSISAEMISYLVFGASMILFRNIKILIFIMIISLSLLFMIYRNDYAFQNGDFGFVRGLFCFNVGVLTYIASRKKLYKTDKFEMPAIIFFLVALYLTYINKGNFERIQYIIMPFLYALIVYIFKFSNGIISKKLNNRFFQFLGKISYSIYLNHYLIVTVLFQVFLNVLKLPIMEPYSTLFFIVYIFLTIVFSYFTYKFIEIKGSSFLKSMFIK
jgi:peptidoglycan/LPS O-acetylase OafA/YrhL